MQSRPTLKVLPWDSSYLPSHDISKAPGLGASMLVSEPSPTASGSDMDCIGSPRSPKRKLFSDSSLGHLRANMRKGGCLDHVVEGSAASSPQLIQQGSVRGTPSGLSTALSADLASSADLIAMHLSPQRRNSLPVGAAEPDKLPLNVQYPSLKGLEFLRTLGTMLSPLRDYFATPQHLPVTHPFHDCKRSAPAVRFLS